MDSSGELSEEFNGATATEELARVLAAENQESVVMASEGPTVGVGKSWEIRVEW